MRFEWDPTKEGENRAKHGLSFGEATALFASGVDYLEIWDAQHSVEEDRIIAIGPIDRGIIVVVYTERIEQTIRIISARHATQSEIHRYREEME